MEGGGGEGGGSLSRAPFTGYVVETNDISDYVWTFTFIRVLIKEVYTENTFLFCGYLGKEITNNPLVLPLSPPPPPAKKKKAVVPSAGAGESGDKNKAITR